MAKYSAEINRTADAAKTVGSLSSDATTPRRSKLYEIICGCEAAPDDKAFKWTVTRTTAAGTSTPVTLFSLDAADAACLSDVGENHSVEPTYTGAEGLSIPLNQRATFRWVAKEGGEIIIPATANAGLGIRTPTAGAASAITATIFFQEE